MDGRLLCAAKANGSKSLISENASHPVPRPTFAAHDLLTAALCRRRFRRSLFSPLPARLRDRALVEPARAVTQRIPTDACHTFFSLRRRRSRRCAARCNSAVTRKILTKTESTYKIRFHLCRSDGARRHPMHELEK